MLWPPVIIHSVLSVIVGLVGLFIPPAFILLLFVFLLFLIHLGNNYFKYSNSAYHIDDKSITVETAALYSPSDQTWLQSQKTQVNNDKIVSYSITQNIFQKLFFNTGTVTLEAAGEQYAELVLADVDSPHKLFEQICSSTGPDINNNQPEKSFEPDAAGILYQSLTVGVMFGFVALCGLPLVYVKTGGSIVLSTLELLSSIAVVVMAMHYISVYYKNTDYYIYSDIIERKTDFYYYYSQKYMNRSIISDTKVSQGAIQRALNLKNVSFSAPGIGEAIVFIELSNDVEVPDIIKDKRERKSELNNDDSGSERPSNNKNKVRKKARNVANTTLTPVFWNGKTSVGLALIIISLWLIASKVKPLIAAGYIVAGLGILDFIYGWFVYQTKAYTIKGYAINEDYSFVSKDTVQVEPGNISFYSATQTIVQRWMGTVTLKLVSVGKQDNICLAEVDEDKLDCKALDVFKEAADIKEKEAEKPEELQSNNPSILSIITQSTGTGLLFISAIASFYFSIKIGASALLLVGGWVYWIRYYHNNYWSTILYKNCVKFEYGLLTTHREYIPYDQNKSTASFRPFGFNTGWLKLDYAGEFNKNNWFVIHSLITFGGLAYNGDLVIPHVTMVDNQMWRLEHYIKNKQNWLTTQKQPPATYKNSTINSFPYYLTNSIFGPFLFAPIAGFVFTLLPTLTGGAIAASILLFSLFVPGYIYCKYLQYELTDHGVRTQYFNGFVFGQQHIVYKQIDNINEASSFSDKIFGTNSIGISTTGSAYTDMEFTYIKNSDEIYSALKNRYGNDKE